MNNVPIVIKGARVKSNCKSAFATTKGRKWNKMAEFWEGILSDIVYMQITSWLLLCLMQITIIGRNTCYDRKWTVKYKLDIFIIRWIGICVYLCLFCFIYIARIMIDYANTTKTWQPKNIYIYQRHDIYFLYWNGSCVRI